MTPVVYAPTYQTYDFGPGHPFTPLRLVMLRELLDEIGLLRPEIVPPPATRDDLLTVHTADFVGAVEAASIEGTETPPWRYGLDTPDVPRFTGMDEAARAVVGGTLHAARLVAAGTHRRVLQFGGGLHHAQHDHAAGFCIYNDLAIGIRHLLDAGFRVAYIDVDVHHGDGVQALFYDARDVLTISLHESGDYLYPGTGFVHEQGEAGGRGFKLNVPLAPGTGDESYLDAFERVVPHALSWFQPDALVVQCGADAHFRDPLADLSLTTRAFERLFGRLLALADDCAGGRAVFTLGGGYDLDASTRVWTLLYLLLQNHPLPDTLPEAWRRRWEKRLGTRLTPTLHDQEPRRAPSRGHDTAAQNRETARRLMESVVQFWY